MGLVRAWARQRCEASGTALVVPAAVAGALAVLAIAGGFGGLAGIGQALSGPPIPARASSSAGGSAPLLASLAQARSEERNVSAVGQAPTVARGGAAAI